MKRLEKIGLLLCVCYVIAYIIASSIESYETKNQYEKQKMQMYRTMYHNERGLK